MLEKPKFGQGPVSINKEENTEKSASNPENKVDITEVSRLVNDNLETCLSVETQVEGIFKFRGTDSPNITSKIEEICDAYLVSLKNINDFSSLNPTSKLSEEKKKLSTMKEVILDVHSRVYLLRSYGKESNKEIREEMLSLFREKLKGVYGFGEVEKNK